MAGIREEAVLDKTFRSVTYLAVDGDDVGLKLRDRIVANDIKGVAQLSDRLSGYFRVVANVLESQGLSIVFCGGDSILAASQHLIVPRIFEQFPAGPCTLSVGVAETAETAYLALQLAKARGKNQVVRLMRAEAETVYDWRVSTYELSAPLRFRAAGST